MVNQPHSFHIPVMGTGFTIDTPLRVARYGISSVISLVDDVLIEQVRQHHCRILGEPFQGIAGNEPDSRARRITAYLNLLDTLVHRQIEALRASPFDGQGEITRYFELLPDSELKRDYRAMCLLPDGPDKVERQNRLRLAVKLGKIDVNIMTKLDGHAFQAGKKLPPEHSDAMAALRGFALSNLHSSIVFSAGINQSLYSYAARFDDFFPDSTGAFKKKIILKVSDYRSALIQGKFLAKRGLWVSEYRIESGLNCGGHAFATQGFLLGPVLEEFLRNRRELTDTLHELYMKALNQVERPGLSAPADMRITVQGGIGSAVENDFLLQYYHVDSTGWGSPFLLVPEVTNVDEGHLQKIINAKAEDVYLSHSSPMGVPFWTLRTSASEENRLRRIMEKRPGSPCTKHFVALNTEFTETPICPASSAYVKRKIEHLPEENLTSDEMSAREAGVLEKACICHDLAGSATLKYGIDLAATPAVCCGPNIVHFSKTASLEEMVGHIYGRLSLIAVSDRPHMFIQELKLYVENLRAEIRTLSKEVTRKQRGYLDTFKGNLLEGIEYYQGLARRFYEDQRDQFQEDLKAIKAELDGLALPLPGEA